MIYKKSIINLVELKKRSTKFTILFLKIHPPLEKSLELGFSLTYCTFKMVELIS